MKDRKLADVGDKIMKGEHPEETMNIEDALWIISLALGLGKSQYRCVSFHIKSSKIYSCFVLSSTNCQALGQVRVPVRSKDLGLPLKSHGNPSPKT